MTAFENQLLMVDSLQIDVISDDVSDAYVSKCCGAISEFENITDAGAKVISGHTLLEANLGYGLRLTLTVQHQQEQVLFDIGPNGKTFLKNCADLNIDLRHISDILITHGHWDHMGGLLDVLKKIEKEGGRPFVHVNPGMFVERGAQLANGKIVPFEKVPSVRQMQSHGAIVINDSAPRLVAHNTIYYSGEIPRVTSFETGRTDHMSRINAHNAWKPDPFLMDERMVVIHVKNLGLFVFSACSHAGSVNVCLLVKKIFPSIPIYLLMGGLHLGGVMEKIIPDTVQAFQSIDIEQFILGHCTGWRALHAFADAFGKKISQSAVGTTYRFGENSSS